MSAPGTTVCAACGANECLHEHHLVPRVHGGADLPTVMLCTRCHGLVHGVHFSMDHRELTLAGLAIAKAKGIKLGSPNIRKGDRFGPARVARQARRSSAREFAVGVMAEIEKARSRGVTSLGQIAKSLTLAAVRTPNGKSAWDATQVRRIIVTAARDENEPFRRAIKGTYLPSSIRISRTG